MDARDDSPGRPAAGGNASPLPLSVFIPSEHVFANVRIGSRKALFDEAAARLVKNCPEVAPLSAFDALVERERIGSTGLGGGIAVPHGRVQGLTSIHAFLFHLRDPIDFNAVDRQLVDLCFIAFAPPEGNQRYLQALASIAAFCREEGNVRALRDSGSEQALRDAMAAQR